MSEAPGQNPRLPEGTEHRDDNPIKELLILLLIVVVPVGGILGAVVFFSDHLTPHIPFSWEKRLADAIGVDSFETVLVGSESHACLMKELSEAEVALSSLVNTLSVHAELDEDIELTTHLVLSDEHNAFATLGGHIFVTSALINGIASENALAMVVAHEIAHVKHRDPARAMSRGVLIQFLLSLVGFSDSTFASFGSHLAMLSYSRDMERAADVDALNTLHARYGTLVGADEFFSNIDRDSRFGKWQTMLQTHPATRERLDTIRARMAETPKLQLSKLDVELQRLREKCK